MVTADEATAVIVAAGVAVVNVAFVDVVRTPNPFVERAAKLYNVAGVKPVNVTECDVASALFNAENVPYAVVGPY